MARIKSNQFFAFPQRGFPTWWDRGPFFKQFKWAKMAHFSLLMGHIYEKWATGPFFWRVGPLFGVLSFFRGFFLGFFLFPSVFGPFLNEKWAKRVFSGPFLVFTKMGLFLAHFLKVANRKWALVFFCNRKNLQSFFPLFKSCKRKKFVSRLFLVHFLKVGNRKWTLVFF